MNAVVVYRPPAARVEPEPGAGPQVEPITDAQAERVLRALAEGAPTLRKACAGEGMPRPWQVLALAQVDAAFADKLELATVMGTDAVHDAMVELEQDVIRPGGVHPQRANVALGSLRWRLERLNRKRWGAKVEVEHKGASFSLTINDQPKPKDES
jgi:hypothetical protein